MSGILSKRVKLGDEHVDRDGDPDLDLDRVLRSAEEGLDAQVLLDPFEEKFHLPPAAVLLGDGESRQLEVIGEEDQLAILGGIVELHSARLDRVVVSGPYARQPDCLIAAQASALVHRMRVDPPTLYIRLGQDDEEGLGQAQGIQACEVGEASVHDVKTASLEDQLGPICRLRASCRRTHE